MRATFHLAGFVAPLMLLCVSLLALFAAPATAVPRHTVLQALEEIFARRDQALSSLSEELAVAPDLEARLAIERRMAEVKQRAVLEMFRLQRAHAQRRGDTRTVETLDATIRLLEHRLAEGPTLPAHEPISPRHGAASPPDEAPREEAPR